MQDKFMTLDEVAEYLRYSKSTVYKMTCPSATKRIPFFKVGNSLRFSLAKINEWMAEHEVLV